MKSKIILTFDVEDWFMVQNMEGVYKRSDWKDLEDRVSIGTDFILQELNKRNILATFFILGVVAEKNPNIVSKIHQDGHEIATHGYSHHSIDQLTPIDFKKDLEKSIKILEGIVPVKIKGFRAPSFSVKKDTLWSLKVIEDLGLTYDSSIYPVAHPNYGIKDFKPIPQKIGRLTEIPMVPFKLLGQNIPVGGGGYFRLFPFFITKWALKKMLNIGSVPAYFHPWEFDPGQPTVNMGSFKNFRHYVGLKRNRKKFLKFLDGFEFTTMKTYLSEHLS